MKELSIEEKAKAYDEAVINGSRLWECGEITRENYEYIFPELKESEDEKIRKWIIENIQETLDVDGFFEGQKTMAKKAIAYLEKQGEQNPAEWDEENLRRSKKIIGSLDALKDYIKVNTKMTDEQKESALIECDNEITWLEKQGSEPNWCHHKVDLSDCSEEYRKAYYDGWNNCNMQHSQCKSELDDVLKCLINGMKFYYEDNKDATWGTDKWSMPVKHIIEVLEKQGEQKHVFIEKGKWYVCIRTSYKPDGEDFIEGKTYYAKENYKMVGECGEVDTATDNPEEFFRSATEEETNAIIKNLIKEQKPYGQREECKDCQMNYAGECKGSCAMKRGEQKPAYTKEYDFHGIKFIPKFAKGDIIKDKKRDEVSTIEDFSYDTGLYTHTYGQFPITIQDNYEIIEQKPADKVEPKFKVGDIITNDIIIGKVDENENNKYHGWFGYDKDLSVHYADIPDVENWHKWTIQDAKDGDVVVDKSDGTVGIFQSIGHHPNGGSYNDPSYCFLHCRYDDGYFYADFENGNAMDSDDVIPAAKEQRDKLEKAMADAGYTFDFERKELKKIEQKPAWSEEDTNLREATIGLLNLINPIDAKSWGKSRLDCIDWLKSLKDRVLLQTKQEWSEEDEKHLNRIIKELFSQQTRSINAPYVDVIDSDITWLKSLRPQSKIFDIAKWSDEDEELRLDAIKYLEIFDAQGIHGDRAIPAINWLKSLRPQKQWKLSEEQIEALESATANCAYSEYQDCLRELIEQLKKLRNE